MTEHHHPMLVHRVRGYTGPKYFCASPHSTTTNSYCDECETYVDSDGCHGILFVYADGACTNNGYYGAESGMGVYFGPNSRHNISTPLQDEHHTSQRAELHAAIAAFERAIDIVHDDTSLIQPNYWRKCRRTIVLLTDSAYVCTGFNEWMDEWAENGWTKRNGSQLANLDLFQRLYNLKHAEPRSYMLKAAKIPRESNQQADALAKNSLH